MGGFIIWAESMNSRGTNETPAGDGKSEEKRMSDSINHYGDVGGCLTMKCTDFIDGACQHDGPCKYRPEEERIEELEAEIKALNARLEKMKTERGLF